MHFRRDLTVSVLCQDLSPVSKHALNKNYYKAHNSVNLPFPTERTEKQFISRQNQPVAIFRSNRLGSISS